MTPIIVYQMGKVGSSTLVKSLDENNKDALHIHRYFFLNNERPITLKLLPNKIKHRIIFNSFLRKEKVKIISFYRDPLPRNISSFFQNLDVYFKPSKFSKLTYKNLKDKFDNANKVHQTPINWFDVEFKRKLNIDIFNYPFDKEKGFTVIKKGHIEIFLCVTNKIDLLEKQIAEFLEIDAFQLKNSNIGDNKWYGDLYNEFKKKYQPSEDMLNSLYGSPAIKHFFCSEEIEKMKSQWTNKDQ